MALSAAPMASAPFCESGTQTCVPCLNDGDCGLLFCLDFECRECLDNADCVFDCEAASGCNPDCDSNGTCVIEGDAGPP